ncbi:MAG: HlyD family efflux transporter periplasmic adaptor subunit [Nitrospirae bacterium]|nr:HlyD family efflux transporter periplasmic adaptor subunit [Nitrospirota bacterium]
MTRARRIVVGAVIAVAAMAIGFWVMSARDRNRDGLGRASGTVEATDAQIGFQAAGRIQDLAVREGQAVRVGQELAHLDRAETEARRQQAIAQVEAARALLEELERGSRKEEVAQGRAALAAATERLRDAERDIERTQTLFDGGAASREALDKARVALDVAKSQYEQAREQVTILETGPRREKIEAQRAQVAQAEAAVRVIDATLANMTLRAPFDGVVTVRHREPGEIVAAGSPVLTVMDPADRWVRIYVPETRIGAVRLGQAAEITSDTYPDKSYRGEVVFIASQAEFTPKTVQTTEERVKLVYAVKVRIAQDPTSDLKPGMPADVRLDLGPGHG